MRVISGEFKGRKLQPVPGLNTRPTSDKVKESLFSIIGPYFDGGVCLDLYAGSGALAIEAVSRGMDQGVLIENNGAALKTIKQNIAATKSIASFDVRKKDASSALSKLKLESFQFSLVFLDPPYAYSQLEENILELDRSNLLTKNALVVCETNRKTDLSTQIGALCLWKNKRYGSTKIWIYIYKNGGEV